MIHIERENGNRPGSHIQAAGEPGRCKLPWAITTSRVRKLVTKRESVEHIELGIAHCIFNDPGGKDEPPERAR